MPIESFSSPVAVIIPAHNEEATIYQLVHDLGELGYPSIVVNDDSDDATALKAGQAGACVLNLSSRMGAWGATQAGLRYALHLGYTQAVSCDGDGQHSVLAIPTLCQELDRGVDMVIGSCVSRGSWMRRSAWRFFRLLGGLSVLDITSGFRGYSHRAMKLLASPMGSFLDYQDVGVLLLLQEQRCSVKEVEVVMFKRRNGKSRIFHNWMAVCEYLLFSSILTVSKSSGKIWGSLGDRKV